MPHLRLLAAAGVCVLLACSDSPFEVGSVPVSGRASVRHVDLNPSGSGYFLSGISPETCFNNLNPNITDADHDWLDDNCEYQLAMAFRPLLQMSAMESCPEGQPYWAAKYFPHADFVRLAYMPAWHYDCDVGYHYGDSEFITVDIVYNPSSNHWQLWNMWTSAHWKATLLGIGVDFSRWTSYSGVEFPDRPQGHPRVWVSSGKHANYPTQNSCNNQGVTIDTCLLYVFLANDSGPRFGASFRLNVLPNRNAGSRFADLLGCTYPVLAFVRPSRCEMFFTEQRFNGWWDAPPGVGGASAYFEHLMSDHFEYSGPNPGPGPAPYSPPNTTFNVSVTGTSGIAAGAWCEWYAATAGGTPPYSYAWTINDQPVGDGSSLLQHYNDGYSFVIRVTATDQTNHTAFGEHPVSVVPGMYCH